MEKKRLEDTAPPASVGAPCGAHGASRARRKGRFPSANLAASNGEVAEALARSLGGPRDAALAVTAPAGANDETPFTIEFAPDQRHPLQGENP